MKRQGHRKLHKVHGIHQNEDGDLVIVPEEAEIVKLIFRLYLEGYSTGKIAKHLEEQGIKTATGQDKWHSTVIDKMLRNEKYMGDALLQKTYTVDFMTKRKLRTLESYRSIMWKMTMRRSYRRSCSTGYRKR